MVLQVNHKVDERVTREGFEKKITIIILRRKSYAVAQSNCTT